MRIYKLQDQSVTSSTTLVDVSDFSIPMKAYRKYIFNGFIYFQTNSTADFKWRHNGPSTPLYVMIYSQGNSVSTPILGTTISDAYSSADITYNLPSGTNGMIRINGMIHNGENQGGFILQFAQNASDPVETKILSGSFLDYEELPAR